MGPLDSVFNVDGLLTDAERDWQERARTFAQKRIRPLVDEDYENGNFRRELVKELGSLGVLGMNLHGHGCAGASAVSYGLVCAELESVDSSWRTFVSVQGSLVMSAISQYGSEEQKSFWLPQLAAGEKIGAFALTEPHGGSDPAGMTTHAERRGAEWVITGEKRWIGLASIADVVVVWAATDEGVQGFLVPTHRGGFSAREITNKLSMRASVQCDVTFDSVRVSESERLPTTRGLSSALSCLTDARFGIAWGVTGIARECIEIAVDRSRSREVFGAPIGATQLVQRTLADMVVEYEKSVLLALHLGRLKDSGDLTPEQVSVGKLNNVRETIKIASQARGLLGADGITADFPIMRHMSNLESVRTYEGTDEIHSLIIGRALTGFSAFSAHVA